MSKIILIRHAQASLGKINYDELSERGFKQAQLLGSYLNDHYEMPESIISGNLKRHKQTVDEITKAYTKDCQHIIDEDWNEFDFKKLIQLYLKLNPDETPKHGDIKAFFSILKKSMLTWSTNELDCEAVGLETWDAFTNRVNRALAKIQSKPNGLHLVVSSGGSIATQLMQILQAPPKTMINLNFQIRNTSFTELLVKPKKVDLVAFNQINHLIEQEADMITFA